MPEAYRRMSTRPSGATGSTSSTVLAFDFGERRTGVAVGDRELGTAHPLRGIASASDAARMAEVGALLREWQPGEVVVGVPRNDDCSPTPESGGAGLARRAERPAARTERPATRAERFARRIEGGFAIRVIRIDESYSSVAAETRLREAGGARLAARVSREREVDSYAAQVLLEQYFAERDPGENAPHAPRDASQG